MFKKPQNSAVFQVWHGCCKVLGILGKAEVQGKRKTRMSLSNANNAVSAIAAIAVSAVLMAYAIIPASPAGFVA